MENAKIGKKLTELRGGTSQAEVAAALRVSRSALAMYERGERIPRDEIKKRISDYYKVGIDELFFQ